MGVIKINDIMTKADTFNTKIYHLYLSSAMKIMIFGMLSIFLIVGVLIVSGILGNEPPKLVGLLLLGIAGWNWYWVLSFPHKIFVSDSGKIEFISVMRKKQLTSQQIKSIKPALTQIGFLVIRTSLGKIRIVNQFDGFHEFIFNLKNSNPSIEIHGC